MKTKKDYGHALRIVKSRVDEWDPYSLIEGGAPQAEFDAESAQIVKDLPRVRRVNDLVLVISTVFCAAFGADTFPPAQCQPIASKLFDDLAREGLIIKGETKGSGETKGGKQRGRGKQR